MIRMPWNNSTAPNAMLEITDVCNIDCKVCYKAKGSVFKSLSEVAEELSIAMRSRKLHTITISGGEPTLHPDLDAIIKMCKKHNLHVFLLTNGVRIDLDYLVRLHDSGLDSIMFHIDEGQTRPDISNLPTFVEIKKRLKELILIAVPLGLDVSMSMTMYDDNWGQGISCQMADFFMSCPDLTFLFISKAIDPQACLFTSTQASNESPDNYAYKGVFFPSSFKDLFHYFGKEYDIEPFSFIPSSNGKYSCWISYFIPVIFFENTRHTFRVKANVLDSILMEIPKKVTGRYIHKTQQNSHITLLRVFINALSTFRLFHLTKFVGNLFRPSSVLRHKMIVFDNGPFLSEKNELEYCEYCPTAIVRDGNVVPCCSSNFKMSKGQLNEHSCNNSMV